MTHIVLASKFYNQSDDIYRAKYLRQNLVFADFLTPEINAMFNKHMKNVGGKLKIKQSYEGTMIDVIAQVPQVCRERYVNIE
jgi:hypothetical protein